MSHTRREHHQLNTSADRRTTAAGHYKIRLAGHLDTRWAAWFDGLSLTHDTDGTTVLNGPVVDQAALHGLLQKVRDIGLPLLSVTQTDAAEPDAPTTEPR